jgi:hypothetical protein
MLYNYIGRVTWYFNSGNGQPFPLFSSAISIRKHNKITAAASSYPFEQNIATEMLVLRIAVRLRMGFSTPHFSLIYMLVVTNTLDRLNCEI